MLSTDNNLATGSGRLRQLREDLMMLAGTEEGRKHFDMTHWKRETPCGTVACAFSYCAEQPWAQALGLTLEPMTEPGVTVTYHPTYRGGQGFTAAEWFFGLDEDQITYLFDDLCYDRETDEDGEELPIQIEAVIDRIDEVLAAMP